MSPNRLDGAPGTTPPCDLLVRSQCFTLNRQLAALFIFAQHIESKGKLEQVLVRMGTASMQGVGILLGIPEREEVGRGDGLMPDRVLPGAG